VAGLISGKLAAFQHSSPACAGQKSQNFCKSQGTSGEDAVKRLKPSLTQARYYLDASLAESGRCQEAIPLVLKEAPHITNPQLKRTVEADGLKCAMALDQEERALDFIHLMQQDFPKDPEVLYITVHVYSDLSTRASQRLLMTAPSSYQVHLLDAEILEMQEKWDEAEAEYHRVLEIDPHVPGIHFRIARLLLTRPKTATTTPDASREFEEELKIDPNTTAAEYVLGELARQEHNFPGAMEHFSRAAKLDPTLIDAFIGQGKSLVSLGRPADAVAPLEAAVRLEPRNPVAHYQIPSLIARRAGRRTPTRNSPPINSPRNRLARAFRTFGPP
jgi:tetratricopeptide (TPR) repeat protein